MLCYADDYDKNYQILSMTTIYGSHTTDLPPQKKSSALTSVDPFDTGVNVTPMHVMYLSISFELLIVNELGDEQC